MFLYNLLLALLSPVLVIYLFGRRARGKEDTSERWEERWGKLPGSVEQDTRLPRFWIHAVSVGEVMAAAPVLRELRLRCPEAFILLSTTTTSGRDVAQKQMPPADEVVYYPLDFPFAVRRALASARPDLILLMEWEIWPNFLTTAKRRGAKIAVLNGRISDKGLRRGRGGVAAFFTRPALQAVDLFAMQSDEDARRAAVVGANPAKIAAFGNTKFDEAATPLSPEEKIALREELGIPRDAPVWICGSTRNAPDPAESPDEEVLIAQAFAQVRERFPDARLIVAPRHLERADKAIAAFQSVGMSVARRSKGEKDAPVLLLDTFGELARAYGAADVAFVGGSLVRQGGQSVFQPLAQGVPAVFGPHMNNQRDIAALAKAEGVGFEVTDAETLAREVIRLLSVSPDDKRETAARARELIARNQGVSRRCVEVVMALLDGTPAA